MLFFDFGWILGFVLILVDFQGKLFSSSGSAGSGSKNVWFTVPSSLRKLPVHGGQPFVLLLDSSTFRSPGGGKENELWSNH